MKKLLVLILSIICLFSEEIVLTKYIDNEPAIGVNFKGPKDVEKILKMDFTVLNHFKVIYNDTNFSSIFHFDFIYSNNTLKVKYHPADSNKTVLIKEYKSNSYAFFPFLVHKAVYDINNYFHMPSAKFLIRKVVYSLLTAPKEVSIYLADYTLSYKKLLINGGLNIFPKWADKNQTTIYFTKFKRVPTLYKFNIYTGKLERILSANMVMVSDVDSKKGILLTLAYNGMPDVYLFKNDRLIRITNYPGIDVSGKFWGDKIVFVSDRFGSPYVFQKDLKTGEVTRILYHGKNQVGVDTYKNYMVISSRETDNAFGKNTFNLFLVNANDDSLKRLTFVGQNMFPHFSIDGNTIMFIKRENFSSKIGIIRLNENKIFYYKLSKQLQSFDW